MLFGWAALEDGSGLEGWTGTGHWGVSTLRKGVGGISVKLFEDKLDAVRYARGRVRAAKTQRYYVVFVPVPGQAQNLRLTYRVRMARMFPGEAIQVHRAEPCQHRGACPDGVDWIPDKTLTIPIPDPGREADIRAAQGSVERISREDRGTEPRGHAQKRTRMGRPGDVKGPASEVRFPGVPGARRREERERAAREAAARRTQEQAAAANEALAKRNRQRVAALRGDIEKLNREMGRLDQKIARGQGTPRDEARREMIDARVLEIEGAIEEILNPRKRRR